MNIVNFTWLSWKSKANLCQLILIIFCWLKIRCLKVQFLSFSCAGALGSTMLAYILPCLFHIRLCGDSMPTALKIKDIAIIIAGIGCGAAGIYAVLLEIISPAWDYNVKEKLCIDCSFNLYIIGGRVEMCSITSAS